MNFIKNLWKNVGDIILIEILGLPNVILMAPDDVEVSYNNFFNKFST